MVGPVWIVTEGRRVECVAAALVGLVGGPDGVDGEGGGSEEVVPKGFVAFLVLMVRREGLRRWGWDGLLGNHLRERG